MNSLSLNYVKIILFISVLASSLNLSNSQTSDEDDERLKQVSGRRFFEVEKSQISQLGGRESVERHCICNYLIPGEKATVSEQLNPYKSPAERVVVYLYKVDGNVHLYIPTAEKQNLLPDLPLEDNDVLQEVGAKPLTDLLEDSPYVLSKRHFKDIPDVDFELPKRQEDLYNIYLYKKILQERLVVYEDPVQHLLSILENIDRNRLPLSILVQLKSLLQSKTVGDKYPKKEDETKGEYHDSPYLHHSRDKVIEVPFERTTVRPKEEKQLFDSDFLPFGTIDGAKLTNYPSEPTTVGPEKEIYLDLLPSETFEPSKADDFLFEPSTLIPEEEKQFDLEIQPLSSFDLSKETLTLKPPNYDLPADPKLPVSKAITTKPLVYELPQLHPGYETKPIYNQNLEPLLPAPTYPAPIVFYSHTSKSPNYEALPFYPGEQSEYLPLGINEFSLEHELNPELELSKLQEQDRFEFVVPKIEPEEESLISFRPHGSPTDPKDESSSEPEYIPQVYASDELPVPNVPLLEPLVYELPQQDRFEFVVPKIVPVEERPHGSPADPKSESSSEPKYIPQVYASDELPVPNVPLLEPLVYELPQQDRFEFVVPKIVPEEERPHGSPADPKSESSSEPKYIPQVYALDELPVPNVPLLEPLVYELPQQDRFEFVVPTIVPEEERPHGSPTDPTNESSSEPKYFSQVYASDELPVPNVPLLEPLVYELPQPYQSYEKQLSYNQVLKPLLKTTKYPAPIDPYSHSPNFEALPFYSDEQSEYLPSKIYTFPYGYEFDSDLESPKFQDHGKFEFHVPRRVPEKENLIIFGPNIPVLKPSSKEYLPTFDYDLYPYVESPKLQTAPSELSDYDVPILYPQDERPEYSKPAQPYLEPVEENVKKFDYDIDLMTSKFPHTSTELFDFDEPKFYPNNEEPVNLKAIELVLKPDYVESDYKLYPDVDNSKYKEIYSELQTSYPKKEPIILEPPQSKVKPTKEKVQPLEFKLYPDIEPLKFQDTSFDLDYVLPTDPNSLNLDLSSQFPDFDVLPFDDDKFPIFPEYPLTEKTQPLEDSYALLKFLSSHQLPSWDQLLPKKHRPKAQQLTFEKWFAGELKDIKKPENLNLYTLKITIGKILQENQVNVTEEGMLIDKYGEIINTGDLKLRPLLIGKPVGFNNLLNDDETKNFKISNASPYLYSLLVSLGSPAKILGLIPLGVKSPIDSSEEFSENTDPIKALPDYSTGVHSYPSVAQLAKPVSQIYFDNNFSKESVELPEKSTTLPSKQVYPETYDTVTKKSYFVLVDKPGTEPVEALPGISSDIHLDEWMDGAQRAKPVSQIDLPFLEKSFEVPEKWTTLPAQQVYPITDTSYVLLDDKPGIEPHEAISDFSSVVHLYPNIAKPVEPVSINIFDIPKLEESFELSETSTKLPTQQVYTVAYDPVTDTNYFVLDNKPGTEAGEAFPGISSDIHLDGWMDGAQIAKPVSQIDLPFSEEIFKVPEKWTTLPTRQVYPITDTSYILLDDKPGIESDEPLSDFGSVVHLYPNIAKPVEPVSVNTFNIPKLEESFELSETSTKLPTQQVYTVTYDPVTDTNYFVLDDKPGIIPIEVFPDFNSVVHSYPSLAKPAKPIPQKSDESFELPETSTKLPTQQVYPLKYEPVTDTINYFALDEKPGVEPVEVPPDSSVVHSYPSFAKPVKPIPQNEFVILDSDESFEFPESSIKLTTPKGPRTTFQVAIETSSTTQKPGPKIEYSFANSNESFELPEPKTSTEFLTPNVHTGTFSPIADLDSSTIPDLLPSKKSQLHLVEFSNDFKSNNPDTVDQSSEVSDHPYFSTTEFPYVAKDVALKQLPEHQHFPVIGSLDESPYFQTTETPYVPDGIPYQMHPFTEVSSVTEQNKGLPEFKDSSEVFPKLYTPAAPSYTFITHEISPEPYQPYTKSLEDKRQPYHNLIMLLTGNEPDLKSKILLVFEKYTELFVPTLNKILLEYDVNPNLRVKIKQNLERIVPVLESISVTAQDLTILFPNLHEDLQVLYNILSNKYNILPNFKANIQSSVIPVDYEVVINDEPHSLVTQPDALSSQTSDTPYYVPDGVTSSSTDYVSPKQYVTEAGVPFSTYSSTSDKTALYEILLELLASNEPDLHNQLLLLLEENPNNFMPTLVEILSRYDLEPKYLLKIKQNIKTFIPRLVFEVTERKIRIPNFELNFANLNTLLSSYDDDWTQEDIPLHDPNSLIQLFGSGKENLVPVLTRSLQDPKLLAILSKNYPQLDFKLIAKYLNEFLNDYKDGNQEYRLQRLITYIYPKITKTRSRLVLPNLTKETLDQILALIKTNPAIKVKTEIQHSAEPFRFDGTINKDPKSFQKYIVSPNVKGPINNVNVFNYRLEDKASLAKLFGDHVQLATPRADFAEKFDFKDGEKVEKDIDVPEEQKVEEDPEFRIIGGSAATGSGAPLSNKGRAGIIA